MLNAVPITVVGNLTDEPELRFTPQGTAVCKLIVAFNPRRYDKDTGKWVDGEASFYRCTAWRQLAENIAESLAKGSRVVLTGTLSQRSWKDAQTGDLKSAWEVTVEAVGPELAYATATVKKMTRTARGETPPDDPWATASRQPVPAGLGDEPPF